MRIVDELTQDVSDLLDTHKFNQSSLLHTHPLFLVSGQDDVDEARIYYVFNPLKLNLSDRCVSNESIRNQLDQVLLKSQKSYPCESGYTVKNISVLINLFQSSTSSNV
jgi:hypothetical protein